MGQYFVSAIIALALNWCELFFIRHWTALTFSILSGVKLIVIIGASWLLLGHNITSKSLAGYVMVVVGVMLYNWSKIRAKHTQLDSSHHSTVLSTVEFDLNLKSCLQDICSKLKRTITTTARNRKKYGKIWSDFPDPYDDGGESNDLALGYPDDY